MRFCYYLNLTLTSTRSADQRLLATERSARQHHERSGISIDGPVPARLSSTSRLRSRPASRSASWAVMNALLVASQASTSSTAIVRVKPKDAVSAGPNGDPAGSSTA